MSERSLFARALRDPIVCLIRARADNHVFDQWIARHRDGAAGDDVDFEGGALERVAFGDAINLLLHRAGVGVESYGLWHQKIWL
jgi:hypothetical protein